MKELRNTQTLRELSGITTKAQKYPDTGYTCIFPRPLFLPRAPWLRRGARCSTQRYMPWGGTPLTTSRPFPPTEPLLTAARRRPRPPPRAPVGARQRSRSALPHPQQPQPPNGPTAAARAPRTQTRHPSPPTTGTCTRALLASRAPIGWREKHVTGQQLHVAAALLRWGAPFPFKKEVWWLWREGRRGAGRLSHRSGRLFPVEDTPPSPPTEWGLRCGQWVLGQAGSVASLAHMLWEPRGAGRGSPLTCFVSCKQIWQGTAWIKRTGMQRWGMSHHQSLHPLCRYGVAAAGL